MIKKKATDFRVGKMISQGAFGEIYIGHEISTGKEVAIKIVRILV